MKNRILYHGVFIVGSLMFSVAARGQNLTDTADLIPTLRVDMIEVMEKAMPYSDPSATGIENQTESLPIRTDRSKTDRRSNFSDHSTEISGDTFLIPLPSPAMGID
jgi:hypothetical protein